MSSSGIRLYKARLAHNFVRSCLFLRAPGEALPPLREMMSQSGLGRVALETALAVAAGEKLIEIRPRVGIFRSSAPLSDAEAVGILVVNTLGDLTPVGSYNVPSESLRTVVRLYELGVARGVPMRVWCCDKTPGEIGPCRRLFMVAPQDAELVKTMEAEKSRVVTVSGVGGAWWVRPPREKSVEAALAYLLKAGHREIGFVYNEPQNGYAPRLLDYYRFMSEHGLRSYRHFVAPYPDEARLTAGLEKMFAAAPRPSAICAPTVWMPTVYGFLTRHSLLPGRDVTMAAIGDPCELRPRPVTVLDTPDRLAELAWELMESSRSPCTLVPPVTLLNGT